MELRKLIKYLFKNYSMINLLFSSSDAASMNIKGFIENCSDKTRFKMIESSSSLDYAEPDLGSELDLFLSKHSSKAMIRSLSCHTPGNYGTALFGGKAGTLSISDALIQSACLRRLHILNEDNSLGYTVTLEVTHHGPSNSVPSLFLEVGSSIDEWSDKETCSLLASLALDLVRDYYEIKRLKQSIVIGIGGPHYAPNFTRKILKDDSLAIGHICPEYSLKDLNIEMFKQMLAKTVPRPKAVLLDWKGVDKVSRDKIQNWCEELKVEVVKLK